MIQLLSAGPLIKIIIIWLTPLKNLKYATAWAKPMSSKGLVLPTRGHFGNLWAHFRLSQRTLVVQELLGQSCPVKNVTGYSHEIQHHFIIISA